MLMLKREAVIFLLTIAVSAISASSCIATNQSPTIEDIPDLVIQSISANSHVDWDSVDKLIELCEDREGLDVLAGCLDESSMVLRLETIPALGWMAYRIIENDPDSDLLFEIMSLIAPNIDVDDEEVQRTTLEAVKAVFSCQINVDSVINSSERLVNVCPENKYFAIGVRTCVGGQMSTYDSVKEKAEKLLIRLGMRGSDIARSVNTYATTTLNRRRENAEGVLEDLPLTLEQHIGFLFDLEEYVYSLQEFKSPYMRWSVDSYFEYYVGHDPSDIFNRRNAEEIAPYLFHESPKVRAAAQDALSDFNNCTSYFREAFENSNARIKLELLWQFDPYATKLDQLTLFDQVLQDESLPVYLEDHWLFDNYVYQQGITSPEEYPFDILTYLLRLLKSDIIEDRHYALGQLNAFGPEATAAVPVLIELLQLDIEEVNRYMTQVYQGWPYSFDSQVAGTLARIGPSASEAIPILIEMRENTEGTSQICATGALCCIGYNKEEMLDWLLERFYSETNNDLLFVIADNLWLIGPDAEDAIPRLIELADNPGFLTWYYSSQVIVDIEGSGDTVLPIIIERTKLEDEYHREEAVRILYDLCNIINISDAIPVILDLLNDTSFEVRKNSCMTLVEYGGFGEQVVPVIVDLLTEDPEQEIYLISLIRDIGMPYADQAESVVLSLLRENDQLCISNKFQIYYDLWGASENLLDILLELVSDPNSPCNNFSGSWLSDLGEEASPVLPKLYELLESDDSRFRTNIQSVINTIESDMENGS